MPDPAAVTLAEVREAFKRADTFATEVGEFRQDIVIPVHNQLRNAGFHIVHALNDDGSTKSSYHLYDARDHCRRAAYDAAVAGILSARMWIDGFREDYRGVVVKEVVDDYPNIIRRARQARDLVGAGRYDEKADGERIENYLKAFRELRDDVDNLDANRDDLDAKKRDKLWRERKGMAAIVGVGIAALGVLLSAFIAVLNAVLSRGIPN